MSYKVKFLFNFFVFQSILSLTLKNEKFYVSNILAIFNFILPDLTYFVTYLPFMFVDFPEIYSMASANSEKLNFLTFMVQSTMVIVPISMGALCITIYKQRYALWKIASICFKVATSSKLKFDDTVEVCMRLYLIVQFSIVIQCLLIYHAYYKMSWISAIVMVVSNWSVNMTYYVMLMGIFFQKFIMKLLDECSRSMKSQDEISNQMCLINGLLEEFNDACGQQLSFVLSTFIYSLITNVSI